jgi:pimeloyl-ACP methyl ester carboxylesterase
MERGGRRAVYAAGGCAELNALLVKAGERAPFILAGAELGAALATLYAARYPDDTARSSSSIRPARSIGAGVEAVGAFRHALAVARARGVLRATRRMSGAHASCPQPAAGVLRAFLNRPII